MPLNRLERADEIEAILSATAVDIEAAGFDCLSSARRED